MPKKKVKKVLKDKELKKSIQRVLGQRVRNIALYRLSLTHSSALKSGQNAGESNERLEFLGDAVLSMIVGEYLFIKYPFKLEGFLTEVRSRIVKRDTLNQLGRKIGLGELIVVDESNNQNLMYNKSLYGNALEALIGALYLDKGYKATKKFILERLIDHCLDIKEVVKNNENYKSQLIEWGQSNGQTITFEIIDVVHQGNSRKFTATVYLNGEEVARGDGQSKKKAEQNAARIYCQEIGNIA